MANVRIIGRLILHDSPSHSSLSRWLSTAAAARPEARNALFKKVVDAMNECVEGGEIVSKTDISNLAAYFRTRRNSRAALQLYEWLDSSNLKKSRDDEARHIHLLGKIEGLASAEKYFHVLHEKSKKACGAILTYNCKEKVLVKALEIFEKMNESNDTGTRDYNSVITLYCDLKQPEKVLSLVEERNEGEEHCSRHLHLQHVDQ